MPQPRPHRSRASPRPTRRERRIRLKAGIADLFADGIRPVRFGERWLEVSLNEMIHRQVEMRHPQPPALCGWARKSPSDMRP
jgi:hypothetical protein